ncbi:DoxX family protein [Reinekea sp. G2M2-21]|uniref:DoxX family protein n=1 Tax=Reinekea sp. G2M2-21 TaxID=2788942 RepID=UPI0018AB7C1F|nr:DoxX family protein [Reinekea sp. G2M2-21]
MNRAKIWGLRVIIALTTFAFVSAGSFKLMGNEMMHASFLAMGLPVWFGYFIGAAEIAGGIGIWFKKLATWAGAGLSIIMIGATYYHLVYQQPSAVPAVVLGVFAALIAASHRKQTAGLKGLVAQ